MPATFVGSTMTIILANSTAVDAKVDLYSEWKEWVATSDNAKYFKAFDTTGGDPVSATQNIAAYYFVRNDLGWTIRPPEANIVIDITGNVFPRDTTIPFIDQTVGAFNTSIRFVVSPQALEVSAGSGLSPTEQQRLIDIETNVRSIEGTRGLREMVRLIGAATAGISSGAPNAETYFGVAPGQGKSRIVASTDNFGNRLGIAYDDST